MKVETNLIEDEIIFFEETRFVFNKCNHIFILKVYLVGKILV
jgi:hypothetical protein